MIHNLVCENDICVGECICKPWFECLDEPNISNKCLKCKVLLSDEDDPDLCEKCMKEE
jgi:hypothetical protein